MYTDVEYSTGIACSMEIRRLQSSKDSSRAELVAEERRAQTCVQERSVREPSSRFFNGTACGRGSSSCHAAPALRQLEQRHRYESILLVAHGEVLTHCPEVH